MVVKDTMYFIFTRGDWDRQIGWFQSLDGDTLSIGQVLNIGDVVDKGRHCSRDSIRTGPWGVQFGMFVFWGTGHMEEDIVSNVVGNVVLSAIVILLLVGMSRCGVVMRESVSMRKGGLKSAKVLVRIGVWGD